MDAPFYLGMTKEDRAQYAALLAGQYVEPDEDEGDEDVYEDEED